MADQQGEEKDEQDMCDMAQGASRTHPSLLSGKVGDRLGAEDRQGTGYVSTVTVSVTNGTGAPSAYVAPAEAGINAAGLLSLGQSASQVFTPHFYLRLPYPLSHLLKELPVFDGTDVNLLCDSFSKVLNRIVLPINSPIRIIESTSSGSND